MSALNDYKFLLFVYGLLRKGINHPMSMSLSKQAIHIGSGSVKGKVFLIDDYPGMVVGRNYSTHVTGDIYGFNDPDLWKDLDQFEEVNVSDEYQRQVIEVEFSGQILNCWTYVYQRSIDGLEEIPSGDFLEYIRER